MEDGPAIPVSTAQMLACPAALGWMRHGAGSGTIIPPWYGERLDLDRAICTCLANAENQARRAQQQAHQDQPGHPGEPEPFRPRGLVSEPSDWIATILKHRADQGGEDSADPGRRGTPASSPPLR